MSFISKVSRFDPIDNLISSQWTETLPDHKFYFVRELSLKFHQWAEENSISEFRFETLNEFDCNIIFENQEDYTLFELTWRTNNK